MRASICWIHYFFISTMVPNIPAFFVKIAKDRCVELARYDLEELYRGSIMHCYP